MFCIFAIQICSLVLHKNHTTIEQLYIVLMNRVQDKN